MKNNSKKSEPKITPKDRSKVLLNKLWTDVNDNSVKARTSYVVFSVIYYARVKNPEKRDYVIDDFVIIQPDFLGTLKPGELPVAVQIISALKMNNCLWYCNYREVGGRLERAVLSMRKKDILFDTGLKGLHIVNPWLMRRGEIRTVIATTLDAIKKQREFGVNLVRDFKAVDEATADLFLRMKGQ